MRTLSRLSGLTNTSPLIILDLANNHNGSLVHGKRIIEDVAEVAVNSPFPIAIKFQYRDLPNFVHPDFRSRNDIKYVNRFLSTHLPWEDFIELHEFIKSSGLLSACTPFDEFSVDKIIEHNFDLLKIASASLTDWPLLEKIAIWDGPIVASTAGSDISDIDSVVTFLENRKKDFALMHCVALYPTADRDLSLNRIIALKKRYENIPIGYSTHESPDNFLAGPLALASGAVVLERHVASNADGSTVNGYSSVNDDLSNWLRALENAIEQLGSERPFEQKNVEELKSLRSLRRYAFANVDIPKGKAIALTDLFFAIPGENSQLTANDFGKYTIFTALKDFKYGESIDESFVERVNRHQVVWEIRDKIKQLVKDSGVMVPHDAALEISHHYGIENFADYGSAMITVVNREYCKKLIFCLPGQVHPDMFHKKKDETFFVLYGEVDVTLDATVHTLREGQSLTIAPGAIHGFSSKKGAVIEEVSSTHFGSDSFYVDETINSNPMRKTLVRYWL